SKYSSTDDMKSHTVSQYSQKQSLIVLNKFCKHLPTMLWFSALAVYLLHTNNQLGSADSAEMITASYNWGFAHPPGYPLYMISSKLFSLISPATSLIYTYNLFSTCCFLAALFILIKAFKIITINPLAIFIGASLYVFSPVNIKWLTVSEVFSLHILLCSSLIYITCHIINSQKITPITRLFGLIAGLGASNHHTIVLLFPGFLAVYLYYWHQIPNYKQRIYEIYWLFFLFLAGLSFYLHPLISSILHGPESNIFRIEIRSLNDLINLFLRRLYGTFSLTSTTENHLSMFYWPQALLKSSFLSPSGLTVLAAFSSIIFIIIGYRRNKKTLFFASMLWMIGCISFFFLANAENDFLIENDIMQRFFLMPNLIFCFVSVLGIDRLISLGGMNKKLPATLFLTFLAIAIFSYCNHNATTSRYIPPIDIHLQHAKDSLDSCGKNSIMISNTDTMTFTIDYLQKITGYREDVHNVMWGIPTEGYTKWTLDKLTEHLPRNPSHMQPSTEPIKVSSLDLMLAVIASGREINTSRSFEALFLEDSEQAAERFDYSYSGINQRLMIQETLPSPAQILTHNAEPLSRYLKWISKITLNRLEPSEDLVIRHYQLYFQTMRKYQFSLDKLILPLDVFKELCHILTTDGLTDKRALFYLGQFYLKYEYNPELAIYYLNEALEGSTGDTEFEETRKSAEHAIRVLRQRIKTSDSEQIS
ncbi:MAG: DUF2723 domain-containing protein, partial [Proteobacteria bacterium]|nr:DUF2723 domain-containing protein [Pseudomonadota bacterium]